MPCTCWVKRCVRPRSRIYVSCSSFLRRAAKTFLSHEHGHRISSSLRVAGSWSANPRDANPHPADKAQRAICMRFPTWQPARVFFRTLPPHDRPGGATIAQIGPEAFPAPRLLFTRWEPHPALEPRVKILPDTADFSTVSILIEPCRTIAASASITYTAQASSVLPDVPNIRRAAPLSTPHSPDFLRDGACHGLRRSRSRGFCASLNTSGDHALELTQR